MAIFASTTTSGYSDPLKAMSIKALEQRYKDMQAQQATQQAAMFTPENTQTPIQGLAQVANVAADAFRSNRADQATAAGRNELAGIIAQGPQGPDGSWSPQQQSVMSRRSPEDLTKIWQQMHENRQNVRTEGGLNTRADALNTTNLAINKQTTDTSRANVQDQEAGATGRTGMTLASKEKEGALDRTASSEALESKQEHETKMARLQADLAGAQKEKDYAQQNNLADRSAAADQNITRLRAELTAQENRAGERFQTSQLGTKIASDERLQGLQREAVAANLERQIAANSGLKDKENAANEKLARIAADINTQRDLIKQAHEERLAADERRSKEGLAADERRSKESLQTNKIASDEKIAAAEAAEKAKALASDPKRNEAIRSAETDYRKGLSHLDNLEEATKILQHPKGIYTGAAQYAAPVAGGIPGVGGMLVDKEKAQNTARFNTIVGEDAIRDMATTLKGSSTNYEMGEFKKMKNDPNISDTQRAAQLQKVVKAARADLAAQAKEVQAIGGDLGRVDTAMRGGGGDVQSVGSEADALKLAPGTRFKLPDGRTGTAR
jgi:hypothetical protein